MNGKCYNVITDGGAKGDGVTDDTAAIQAAINQTPVGGELCFPYPKVSYLISKTLNVQKPICIKGQKGPVNQSVPGQGGFVVTSSGVSIKGMTLIGPQFRSQTFAEQAIAAVGASAANPLICVDLCDNIIQNWGMYGIYAQFVNLFTYEKNDVSNVNYAGIMNLSVINGIISDNEISNVIASPNAYGIAVTRNQNAANELVSDPLSAKVTVCRNKIDNVLAWEAINTHAGQHIRILDNKIYGCPRGVAVVPCPNAQDVATYAPLDCVVMDNEIDSGVTDGSAVYGITISGTGVTLGSQSGLATDCKVYDNKVNGYGSQSNPLGMAVYLVATQRVKVLCNEIFNPGNVGIGLYYNNWGFDVAGNEVTDPWSMTQQGDSGLRLFSDYNVGSVTENRYLRGTKSATYVALFGLYLGNFPHNLVYYGKDYSEMATAVYDPGNHRV